MRNSNKRLRTDLERVKLLIASMKRKWGKQFEFIFMGTFFDKKGNYTGGFELADVFSSDNYKSYVSVIETMRDHHLEEQRYRHYIRLGEFRVICKNDSISEDYKNLLESSNADWIQAGETYVVTEAIEGPDGFNFRLRTLDGHQLKAPPPIEGYHSLRFVVCDYTKLN